MKVNALFFIVAFAGCAAQQEQHVTIATPAAAPPAPARVAPLPVPPLPGNRLLLGDIPVASLDGKPGWLADYIAPVTLVGFWASFCKPCIRELPYLDALYREHRLEPDVAVLSVNLDEPVLRRHLSNAEGARFSPAR